jgi:hypothetical protein
MTVRKSTNIPPPPQWLFIAIVVSALLPLLASICHAEPRPRAEQEKMLPPPKYDHDYIGDLLIIRKSSDELVLICSNALKPGQKALGCAVRSR